MAALKHSRSDKPVSASVENTKQSDDKWAIQFKGGIGPFIVLSEFALRALVAEAVRQGIVSGDDAA